jgi:hypothetical protein
MKPVVLTLAMAAPVLLTGCDKPAEEAKAAEQKN